MLPVPWRWRLDAFTSRGEDRVKRILPEHMLDVSHEQLLMLLLVVNAEGDNRLDFAQQRRIGRAEQIVHRFVDCGAVTARLRDRRSGDQAALVASMHRTGGDIIGVEE